MHFKQAYQYTDCITNSFLLVTLVIHNIRSKLEHTKVFERVSICSGLTANIFTNLIIDLDLIDIDLDINDENNYFSTCIKSI